MKRLEKLYHFLRTLELPTLVDNVVLVREVGSSACKNEGSERRLSLGPPIFVLSVDTKVECQAVTRLIRTFRTCLFIQQWKIKINIPYEATAFKV